MSTTNGHGKAFHRHLVRPAASGIGLVELMIAMVLGLLLVAGIIQIFASSKQAYAADQELADLQENARYALRTLARDVRMAGFTGCVEDPQILLNPAGSGYSSTLFDINSPIGGWEATGTAPGNAHTISTLDPTSASTSDWTDANGDDLYAALNNRVVPGSDVVVVKRVGANTGVHITGTNNATSASLNANGATGLDQYEIIMVSEGCEFADIVQKRNNSSSSGISRGNGAKTNPGPGNVSGNWATSYTGAAEVRRFMSTAYYVGVGTGGEPALFRVSFNGMFGSGATTPPNAAFEELVPGVESFQVLYGEDTNGDGVPNQYVPADAATPANVVTARIDLIMRTDRQVGASLDNGPFTLSGGTIVTTGQDRRIRYVVSTTIDLRNV